MKRLRHSYRYIINALAPDDPKYREFEHNKALRILGTEYATKYAESESKYVYLNEHDELEYYDEKLDKKEALKLKLTFKETITEVSLGEDK